MRYLVCFMVLGLGVLLVAQGREKITKKLNEVISFEYEGTPLKDVLDSISDLMGLRFKFDKRFEKIPVTATGENLPLKDALRIILASGGLDFIVMEDCIFVSTKEEIERRKDVESVARSLNEFGLALYRKLAAKRKGNIFFSPFSLEFALVMTYAGAHGKTKDEMKGVLHLRLSDERLHRAFAALERGVLLDSRRKEVSLSVANAVWGQCDYPLKKEFINLLQKSYSAGLRLVDFAKDAEKARKTINGWVEKETKGRIKDLIPRGDLDGSTRLVLTNAIYFKGFWKHKFDKRATKKMKFYTDDGKTVDVEMMQIPAPNEKLEEKFRYLYSDGIKILELPYANDEISMVILLPDERDGLAELEKKLTMRNLRRWLSDMRKRRLAYICVPKFEITWGTEALKDELMEMGMVKAFDKDEADFTGMTEKRPGLYIKDVFHKAYVKVEEEGTEAAAASAVVIRPKSVPLGFLADHPFIFLIYHKGSKAILFLGRLVNPAAK